MHDAPEFLRNLALVLCVAAATSLLFQRLRQPVVFGYLIAGMLVGPHIPVPLVADAAMVRSLSELGVILVMFSLGLEFRLRSVLRVGQTAGLIALIECSAMLWLGYTAAHLLGWSTRESLFAGAFAAISSTTILVRSFKELGIKGKVTELVFGVLIFEDLIAILLLAVLTAVAAGGELSVRALSLTIGRLVSFLLGLAAIGMLVVPRVVRYVVRARRPELTLVSSIGICFASALLALTFGYSVALGAFIAGSLVAESGKGTEIAHLVEPVRDLFAAIFFVSVGMLIDPVLVAQHWGAVLLFTVLVVIGKTVFVSIGAFLAGHNPRTSVRAGMSLSQIGEFSFIIAGLGMTSGATRSFLYAVAVAVSAITSLGTPWMIRASGPAASWLDAQLPNPVQTFIALYGSWIERMRATPARAEPAGEMRRQVRALAIDACLLATIVILAGVESDRFAGIVGTATGLAETWTRFIVAAGAALVGAPLVIGLARNARLLGAALAERALPAVASGRLDLAASPRRALVVTLQFGVLAVVGAPLLVITQPFVPMLGSASVLAVIAVAFGVAFWRRATDLYGHTRAGAEVIVMALAQHDMDQTREMEVQTIERLHAVLPGLGEPVPVRLDDTSRAVGRTLASLDLRGRTGATVLAIRREGGNSLVPTGHEVLRTGDVLALAGSGESIEAARRKLGGR
jgi:CPA2 family monovalent cation:H+ antiporter-2